MVAAKSRRSGKASQALRLARGEVLSDRYPTQYLPEVGRQVMADGGVPMSEGDRNAQLNDLVAYADRLDRSARAKEAGEALAQTWPVQLARSVVGGAALPRDVYEGRADPTSEIGIQRAADLAGTVMGGGMGASRPAGSVGMGGREIRAYHGSPHDFDRFDLSKVGTGQGAQVYGRGLYFAENEPVAFGYKRNLAPGMVDQAGQPIKTPSDGDALAAYQFLRSNKDDFDLARASLAEERSTARGRYRQELDAISDWLDVWQGSKAKPAGRMYEVNIRANPERFLDWDKPFLGQKAAEEALAPIIKDVSKPDYRVRAALFDANQSLRELGDVRRAEDVLREAGIPGIKYLDRGAMAYGENAQNYVVFDDKLIDILRKYAKGGVIESEPKRKTKKKGGSVVDRALMLLSKKT